MTTTTATPTTETTVNAVSREEYLPYVLRALQLHATHSLTTAEVFRVADALLIDAGETRYASSQLTRTVINDLVEANQVYRRIAAVDSHDHPSVVKAGQTTWLASVSELMPAWTPDLTLMLDAEAVPSARLNPAHSAPGAKSTTPSVTAFKSPTKVAEPAKRVASPAVPDRAGIITTLVKELAADLDAALLARGDTARLEAEVRRLNTALELVITERNAAREQLRQIADAQKAIAALLGSVGNGVTKGDTV